MIYDHSYIYIYIFNKRKRVRSNQCGPKRKGEMNECSAEIPDQYSWNSLDLSFFLFCCTNINFPPGQQEIEITN
jgi:hypothetical protein